MAPKLHCLLRIAFANNFLVCLSTTGALAMHTRFRGELQVV